MKTQLSKLVLGLALLSPAVILSQQAIPCDTYRAMENNFALHPESRAQYEAAQQQLRTEAAAFEAQHNSGARTQAAVQYTIPVVFHVLHTGGIENISDAAINAALVQVNKDYARQSSDVNTIFAPFQALYIDSQIKMMLAKKDPDGNCTTGITRHYDVKKDWDQGAAATSAAYWSYTWDPTKYLNIYIVASIVPQGTVTQGGYIVGYTYKPGTSFGPNTPVTDKRYCIVYRSDKLAGFDSRSLSHEMGHWFNLDHTFGATNNPGTGCGDDGIADTPPTKGNFSTCPASATNTVFTCNSPDNSTTPVSYYQNVENIMDYADCPKNFTTGQTNAMQSALNSSIGGRNNLWSPGNLAATDVNGTQPCAPIAEFLSTNGIYTVCSGGSLNLKDFSYNGTISTYQWAASAGATAANPSSSLTSMLFPTPGTSNVTLTVNNAQGTSTKIRSVVVLDGSVPGGLPPVESFENPGVPNHWMVSSPTTGGTTWERTETASFDGAASYYIEGSTQTTGKINYLQMPVMNMAANTDKDITYAVAYAKATSTQNDQFKLQGSKDCGGSWIDIFSQTASVLSQGSGGTSPIPFIPANNEWKTYTLSVQNNSAWGQFVNLPSVLLRFTFIESTAGGGGNNMYIDAIKTLTAGVTGINALTKSLELSVYPNPTASEVTVNFKLDDAASININVVDIYGKVVLPVINSRLAPGQQSISINKDGKLAGGIYFINMTYNGTRISNKLIIQ